MLRPLSRVPFRFVGQFAAVKYRSEKYSWTQKLNREDYGVDKFQEKKLTKKKITGLTDPHLFSPLPSYFFLRTLSESPILGVYLYLYDSDFYDHHILV